MIMFALTVICLGGCGSAKLSRSHAQSLILQDNAFKPDAITLDFRVGAAILDVGPIERDMEKAGLIKIVSKGCRPYNTRITQGGGHDCGEISLTEEGAEASRKWKGNPWDNGKGMDYEIPVASRVVKEISGIEDDGEKGTAVEFSWGCQPDDAARKYRLDITPPVFMASGARCPENIDGSKKSTALFKHDGTGWRLERIKWQE